MTGRPRIYVSGPLSSSGRRSRNIRIACQAGRALIQAGFAPLVPHLTGTAWMDPDDSLSHAVWIAVDLPWVEVSDAVLRLPGESVGADAEVDHARAHNIPVFYSIEEVQKCFQKK